MSQLERILLGVSICLYVFLSLFSYAYVDLNLTISKNPLVYKFVSEMQKLGYFNRLEATFIYLLVIFFAFAFFILNLWLFTRSKVGVKYLKVTTVTSTLILICAYPFLSSDLFNYLFDAKIILKYHASPYTHRALDFPNDEWLRFMRWIHRYSPYGPLWLLMSLIPASLGFGKFILNFILFKIFIGVFHLVNCYLIYKILNKINPNYAATGTAFYALNPLFLIEGVANSHNDIVLATFIILGIYFSVNKKINMSYFSLAIGALIKYITALLIPLYILKKIRTHQTLILLNVSVMAIFTYLFSSFRITVPFVSPGATQVQFQPWYLFWTLPLVALLPNRFLITLSIALALGASLRYLPYLYFGDWSHQGTINFMYFITIVPPLIVGLASLARKILKYD